MASHAVMPWRRPVSVTGRTPAKTYGHQSERNRSMAKEDFRETQALFGTAADGRSHAVHDEHEGLRAYRVGHISLDRNKLLTT